MVLVSQRIGVVAVVAVDGAAHRAPHTGPQRPRRIAAQVAVRVDELIDQRAVVDQAVTVVVDAVANLAYAGTDIRSRVVAVPAAKQFTLRIPVTTIVVVETIFVEVTRAECSEVAVFVELRIAQLRAAR